MSETHWGTCLAGRSRGQCARPIEGGVVENLSGWIIQHRNGIKTGHHGGCSRSQVEHI
jgi:hypothetical protein